MFATRLFTVALFRSARAPFQSTYKHHFSRRQRSFSVSPINHANPPPENLANFTAELRKTSLWKKLANYPDAIAVIEDFGRVLQKGGVDPSAGRPSTFKIMKLATNPEFRASLKRVKEEMEKAGLDLNSPAVLEEVMNLQKTLGPK